MDREDFSFSLRFGANLSARQWLRIFLFVFFFRVFWGNFDWYWIYYLVCLVSW